MTFSRWDSAEIARQKLLWPGVSPDAADAAARLAVWRPDVWPVAQGWRALTDSFFASEAGQRLGEFVQERLDLGAVVYPPQPLRALALTPLDAVRVVVLGQDPYHGAGQAEGLAFSVAPGQKPPPSLRNIFKELQRDLGLPPPVDGSLVRWARQGVLLLNTSLTVEAGQPASHAHRGWELLTEAILKAVLQSGRPLVFMLWGAHAQARSALIGAAPDRHLVLTANHPSPLSASRGPAPFLGCGHFSAARKFLASHDPQPLIW